MIKTKVQLIGLISLWLVTCGMYCKRNYSKHLALVVNFVIKVPRMRHSVCVYSSREYRLRLSVPYQKVLSPSIECKKALLNLFLNLC